MKKPISAVSEMLNNERVYEVVLEDSGETKSSFSVPLAKTTTKQRAQGFITKTKNLWKDFDLNSDMRFVIDELVETKKGKKTSILRKRVE